MKFIYSYLDVHIAVFLYIQQSKADSPVQEQNYPARRVYHPHPHVPRPLRQVLHAVFDKNRPCDTEAKEHRDAEHLHEVQIAQCEGQVDRRVERYVHVVDEDRREGWVQKPRHDEDVEELQEDYHEEHLNNALGCRLMW